MWHLRFTPYDISGYTFDFVRNYTSYIVAQEDLDDDGSPLLHYHILIDTDYGDKSIRDAAKEFLKIPKAGRGKNNKYYALIEDWKDPAYICKYNNIICHKGYTEKALMDYAIEGKKKYLDKKSLEKDLNVMTIQIEKRKTKSVDRIVSEQILAWWYELEHAKKPEPSKREVITKACELYRSHDKGINMFKVRDIVHTLYYDVETTRDQIIEKIFAMC